MLLKSSQQNHSKIIKVHSADRTTKVSLFTNLAIKKKREIHRAESNDYCRSFTHMAIKPWVQFPLARQSTGTTNGNCTECTQFSAKSPVQRPKLENRRDTLFRLLKERFHNNKWHVVKIWVFLSLFHQKFKFQPQLDITTTATKFSLEVSD